MALIKISELDSVGVLLPSDIIIANSGGVTYKTTTRILFEAAASDGLLSLDGLEVSANKMIYGTDTDTFALTDLTPFARTLIAGSDQSAMLAILGVLLASQAEAEAGSNATKYMTPLRTAQAIAAQSIGVDQEWTQVGPSRSVNTVFQNTTGRPIAVFWVNASLDTGASLEISPDNVTFTLVNATSNSNGKHANVIVPTDHYYKITGIMPTQWRELR